MAKAEGVDAIVLTVEVSANKALIERLPHSVKAIATYSVGTDHIDLEAARARGLVVLSTPGVLADSVAEVGLFLLLGAARRATESIALIRSGQWKGWSPTQLIGSELKDKCLGIFGMGQIGRAVARRAAAFGMTISYHNRSELPQDLAAAARFEPELDRFLGTLDAIVLACPSTPETRHFLNAERIARMKPGAFVVNIARGDVVDDDALIAALSSGRIAAAGLDVFAGEPAFDPRYGKLPNVFMLPHIGSSTEEARLRMGRILIEGLEALRAGRDVANRAG